MININKKDLNAFYYKDPTSTAPKIIYAVYKGAKLIWQYIRSCFGSGFWVNKNPWINNDAWKN